MRCRGTVHSAEEAVSGAVHGAEHVADGEVHDVEDVADGADFVEQRVIGDAL